MNIKYIIIFLFIIIFYDNLDVSAQKMYIWTDENGVTQASDKPPPDDGKYKKVKTYGKDESERGTNNEQINFENEPSDFRGVKWGMNISELSDMILTRKYDDESHYIKRNEKNEIGKAKIESINYIFYKNKFSNCFIIFKGIDNYISLSKIYHGIHGFPISKDENGSFIEEWRGKKLFLSLEYKKKTHNGFVLYTHMPLLREKDRDDMKSGSNDL